MHDLRTTLRIEIQRNQNDRDANEGLTLAIENLKKQLQSKSEEGEQQDKKIENCEMRMEGLERRLSVLTFCLRQVDTQVKELNTNLETKRRQEEEESLNMIPCLKSVFQATTDRMSNIADNMKRLENNFLQIENRVHQDITAEKQTLLKTLLKEIYELEDENDNLLKFAEDALGLKGQDTGSQVNEKLNSQTD
ncbi:unnamed protein product [Porites evermanni]|uniref:Uncharacterized protein n=1 Tax=Porites evermanni TaxID=104178 RepID=A0ABN8LJ68_9CNID|nr:unnamed protein product [Porites evermanni]